MLLPVPVSPMISTGKLVAATRRTLSSSSRTTGERPTKRPNDQSEASSLRLASASERKFVSAARRRSRSPIIVRPAWSVASTGPAMSSSAWTCSR